MTAIIWIAMNLVSGDSLPQAVPLKDGDRIVLVGDTLIEREQYYGHFETTLLCMYPELKLTFRNLGWSGDTPSGLSRCYFDPPEVGFQRLVEQIKACQPTVLIVGYGMAHALEFGDAALFEKEMNRLLDAVGELGARTILISPISSRTFIADWKRLREDYDSRIKEIAAKRQSIFVDLTMFPVELAHREADGMTLHSKGYHELANMLGERLTDRKIDDSHPKREEIRQLVIRKNALYFQRYRPQNITYLLGFRAYEQGQNAKEIEALDPMIAEIEKKIDELKVPKPIKAKITRIK